MSLLDRLENLEPQPNRSHCNVCTLLEHLDDKERQAVIDVMAAPINSPARITDKQLSDALKGEGYPISSTMVYRHRKNHMDQ